MGKVKAKLVWCYTKYADNEYADYSSIISVADTEWEEIEFTDIYYLQRFINDHNKKRERGRPYIVMLRETTHEEKSSGLTISNQLSKYIADRKKLEKQLLERTKKDEKEREAQKRKKEIKQLEKLKAKYENAQL